MHLESIICELADEALSLMENHSAVVPTVFISPGGLTTIAKLCPEKGGCQLEVTTGASDHYVWLVSQGHVHDLFAKHALYEDQLPVLELVLEGMRRNYQLVAA